MHCIALSGKTRSCRREYNRYSNPTTKIKSSLKTTQVLTSPVITITSLFMCQIDLAPCRDRVLTGDTKSSLYGVFVLPEFNIAIWAPFIPQTFLTYAMCIQIKQSVLPTSDMFVTQRINWKDDFQIDPKLCKSTRTQSFANRPELKLYKWTRTFTNWPKALELDLNLDKSTRRFANQPEPVPKILHIEPNLEKSNQSFTNRAVNPWFITEVPLFPCLSWPQAQQLGSSTSSRFHEQVQKKKRRQVFHEYSTYSSSVRIHKSQLWLINIYDLYKWNERCPNIS